MVADTPVTGEPDGRDNQRDEWQQCVWSRNRGGSSGGERAGGGLAGVLDVGPAGGRRSDYSTTKAGGRRGVGGQHRNREGGRASVRLRAE